MSTRLPDGSIIDLSKVCFIGLLGETHATIYFDGGFEGPTCEFEDGEQRDLWMFAHLEKVGRQPSPGCIANDAAQTLAGHLGGEEAKALFRSWTVVQGKRQPWYVLADTIKTAADIIARRMS